MKRTTKKKTPEVASAMAPASVGNAAVGFDVLGHSLKGPSDRATVRRLEVPEVRMRAIRGVVTDLPMEARRNTAGRALEALREGENVPFGFEVELDKGIPLGSGLGGSAASAVAALVAANALLAKPLPREALYPYALAGEAAASGSAHGDNVGPQLVGGLVLAGHSTLVKVPVPSWLHVAVVHPHAVLETKVAREALQAPYTIGDFPPQLERFGLVLLGCWKKDEALLRQGLEDVLVEPRRAHLIAGFGLVKAAALAAGAIGASISGAGPSVFAWCQGPAAAKKAGAAMRKAFGVAGLEADVFLSKVDGPKAELVRGR